MYAADWLLDKLSVTLFPYIYDIFYTVSSMNTTRLSYKLNEFSVSIFTPTKQYTIGNDTIRKNKVFTVRILVNYV